jgi:Ca2+/Na+ antiporter
MKYNTSLLLRIISPFFLILGDVGLFFDKTMFAGYILFVVGCSLGLIGVALSSRFDAYERFHLLTSCLGFGILGVFLITGILERVIILALVLFVLNFVLMVMNLTGNNKKVNSSEEENETEVKDDKYKKFHEKKLYDELENIKDEFNHIQILEEGDISSLKDLSLKNEAEQIKKDISDAIIVQDPKEGRYFFKESGKMFHVKGCVALKKLNKKEIKSSNSRTELLAKGYKSCKSCNA